MAEEKDVLILAIESSCDETAAAVVKNGREVLSNVISSQIELHKLYGGVVPEIASRKHIEKINQVIEEALTEAGVTLDDLDAVGVTYGPGLVGALLVGVAEAKAIAYAKKLPLVGVHHIEGHISANYIENKELEPPFICLVVSGGHTHLVCVKDYGKYEIIGRTRDDAAGEAFDKVARAIGLGYPGGPKIDKLSKEGNAEAIAFPRAKIEGAEYDFSFSGVKSAVLNYINGCKMKGEEYNQADIAASFQKAVTDVLVTPEINALMNPLPVGKEKPGTWIYIMDENGNLLSDGSKGEIVIAGDSVSIGYWNRPELTQKAFSTCVVDGKEYRLYHTGDKGYKENGQLYYCGRIDLQIKLHGYRIEIEDIESNLMKLDCIQKVAVMPVYRGEQVRSLTAYIVPKEPVLDEFEAVQQIRRRLKEYVPEYMIPKKICFLEKIPMTNNGKVDRRALEGLGR